MANLKDFAKAIAGTGLEIFRRDLAAGIDRGERSEGDVKARELILRARLIRARMRGDANAIEKAQFAYWGGATADTYYDRFLNRFRDWFLGPHQVIVDELAVLLRQAPYRRLVEVGCGDGRVLEHLANKLDSVGMLVGIDINPSIIERNRNTYAAIPRMRFESGDATAWLRRNPTAGTVLMTYGGVMEYFTAPDLRRVFADLARSAPAAVALVEPVHATHDLANDPDSHVFGEESSFSHNHRSLLEAEGYTVRYAREMDLGKVRWMLMIATSGA